MNVYEIVTDEMVKLLEAGTVPWRKPWRSGDSAPRNLVSKKPYRGINVFLLMARGYAKPYWLTYKQAQDLGGNVRKGEKSTLIVFWKVEAKRDADAQEGEISSADRSRFMLRYYRVFNIDQCDMPQAVLDKLPKPADVADFNPIAAAEKIVSEYPAKPTFQTGAQTSYSPAFDTITLPARETFEKAESYYSTAFHEMGHSTGHKDRLNREAVTATIRFGSGDYSREELVAEMTAAFLSAEAGTVPATIENSAAYIASWLKVLKADTKAVVIAAAQAQKASHHILNRKPVACTETD
jgi:antirestriction protein ArdC